jgi:uncharacterized protein YuzE
MEKFPKVSFDEDMDAIHVKYSNDVVAETEESACENFVFETNDTGEIVGIEIINPLAFFSKKVIMEIISQDLLSK